MQSVKDAYGTTSSRQKCSQPSATTAISQQQQQQPQSQPHQERAQQHDDNRKRRSHLAETWKGFLQALMAPPTESFNPFEWIYRLFEAFILDVQHYALFCCHSRRRQEQDENNSRRTLMQMLPPLLPVFCLFLIVGVGLSYMICLRTAVVQTRWCRRSRRLDDNRFEFSSSSSLDGGLDDYESNNNHLVSTEPCTWLYVHDSIVLYLVTMILFHYLQAVVTSPGVALTSDLHDENEEERNTKNNLESPCANSDSNQSTRATVESVRTTCPSQKQWTPQASQGGFLCFHSKCDPVKEQSRLVLYGTLQLPTTAMDSATTATKTINKQKHNLKMDDRKGERIGNKEKSLTSFSSSLPSTFVYPSPDATYCHTCQIIRPPRCHHCRTCRRCILQFDHHCIWINNCIGYNNYRNFVLFLFFLCIGCLYGVALLWIPFYVPFKQQIQLYGWKWMYSNGAGFLDLPPPVQLLRMLVTGTLPAKSVIDMVYPLLFGVGTIMIGFTGFHIQYILLARTSLEHRVMLEYHLQQAKAEQQQRLMQQQQKQPPPASGGVVVHNPFDQAYLKNMRQIIGPRLWMVFLPIPTTPPPPFVPTKKQT